jgi:hypothetical protein
VFAEGSSNIVGLACGPLRKPRYINPKIEKELVEFKKEIEEKFEKSEVKHYKFPFVYEDGFLPEPRKSSQLESLGSGGKRNSKDGQSQLIQYLNESPKAKPHVLPGISKNSQRATNKEQSRYQDIIRSVNDAGQFIKAKQAIAAQDKRNGRKRNHNHNLSELPFQMQTNHSTLMMSPTNGNYDDQFSNGKLSNLQIQN